jgi:hypothetical protein
VLVKKIIFILISFLTLVISIGSFGIFKLFLNQYKSEVRSSINTNKNLFTDIIYINPHQLFTDSKTITWEDNNHEIVYNGELYDIVSIGNENGKVRINAISDKKETEYKMLYAQKEELNNQKSNSPIKILKQFFNLKFVQINHLDLKNIEKSNDSNHYLINSNSFALNSGYKTLDVPPPISAI